MTEEQKSFEINGHQIELSEGRAVWAGEHDESWYIQFRSKEGDIRKLRVSYEAADALVKLLASKPEAVFRYILHVDAVDAALKWEAVDSTPR